jgi:hypothetical protein
MNTVLESGLVFRRLWSNKLANADGQWKDGVDKSYSKKGLKEDDIQTKQGHISIFITILLTY